jgi:hypothetical protein
METFKFNNRLQTFWTSAGKQEKALPAMSGFVKNTNHCLGDCYGKDGFTKQTKHDRPFFTCRKFSVLCQKLPVYQSIASKTDAILLQSIKFIKNKKQWKLLQ